MTRRTMIGASIAFAAASGQQETPQWPAEPGVLGPLALRKEYTLGAVTLEAFREGGPGGDNEFSLIMQSSDSDANYVSVEVFYRAKVGGFQATKNNPTGEVSLLLHKTVTSFIVANTRMGLDPVKVPLGSVAMIKVNLLKLSQTQEFRFTAPVEMR